MRKSVPKVRHIKTPPKPTKTDPINGKFLILKFLDEISENENEGDQSQFTLLLNNQPIDRISI